MRSSRKLFTAPRYEYFKKYNLFVNDNTLVNSTYFRYMYTCVRLSGEFLRIMWTSFGLQLVSPDLKLT